MIRVLLAVAVTVALVGVSMPAIDRAAGVRSDEAVRADVAAINRAAASLIADEELPPRGGPGPRRHRTVSLPDGSLTRAAVDYVAVGATLESDGPDRGVIAYRIDGRTERVIHLDAPLRSENGPGDPIVLRGTGDRRLTLTLERGPDGPIVVASRPEV